MFGYYYTTTTGKKYLVQFGMMTGDCETINITPYCLGIMETINSRL